MALYLIVHLPVANGDDAVRAPSRLAELAQASLHPGATPRWIKTWSPDVGDDRLFTLWEAETGAAVEATMREYGFLDDMVAEPLRVREWGPAEVIGAESTEG